MSKRIVLSILMAMVLTLTLGCKKVQKAGTDAVSGTLGSVVDGTQDLIERKQDEAYQRVAKRLGDIDLKVSRWRQVDDSSSDTPGKKVQLIVLATNRSDKSLELADVVERKMILLLDTDGVSHPNVTIKGDSLIPANSTIRTTLTVQMLDGTPGSLRVVGKDPVPVPATTQGDKEI
jgi:hypothetical protein